MLRSLFIILLITCSGSTWADTAQDGICKKLPIDHPKRENQPSYRLRCERAANGDAQVQLLIDGEKPLVLAGVEKEPLAAGNAHFDPASVSVRLLEGQPNLYWIRYGHRRLSEAGGDNIDHQRDWVVQQGDTANTLFDKWTEVYENNRSGNFLSATADVAIDYRGSTLRATSTRFRGETVEEDILEPGEPGYRESSSTESLTKVTREIDAGTGRLILERTISAQFNGNALFLDDGISGWLLITKPDFRLVYWKPGEMFPRHLLPDPEKLEAIPSVAACWLYNRTPWDPAHATRNRPPASPDQVRPDHFVPDRCCAIQASADGKRILLHETVKDKQESEKPGRWLALYDVPSKTCYSANLAKDGRWGRAPFDRVGNPVFSPDGGKLGYRAKQGDRWFVVINDQRTPDFDLVSAPVFSPDGQNVAYWARQDKKEFIVRDDRKGPAFDGAGFPVFSPDGGKVAYRAREGKQWFVMRGDEKGPAFDDIGYYTLPDSGRGSDIADVVFSPDGRQLAYAARRGEQWFMVRDGQPGPAFAHVGLPVFGPDGRLAHRARQNDQECILLEGKKGPEFDFVGNPVFSPDGREVAYWAQQGEAEFILHGERKGPAFDKAGAPVFNRDGSQVVYWATRKEKAKAEAHPDGYLRKEFILSGEKKGPEFDSIESPVFNPHTDQIAYRVRQSDKEFVMLGDQKGPEFDFDDSSRSRPLVFSPDGRQLAYRAKQDGKEFILLGENKGPAFDEVGDPVFRPDGGRLAYRAQLGGQGSQKWLMVVSALENQKTAAGAQAVAPRTVPLTKRVPQLLPHPVAVGGDILGGATKFRWIGTDVFTPPDLEGGQCRPLNQESIPGGLIYKFYGFDKPLGECTGSVASVCISGSSGTTHLSVDFPGCAVKDFKIAVAAPWNALPRRPRIIKDHQAYQPIVRKFLDGKGRKQAPIHIESVHGIDLDGDGKDEFVINAGSRKDLPEDRSAKDYSIVLLVRTINGKNEAISIDQGWWTQEDQGYFETFHDIRYADVNGDGIMEVFIDSGISAEHWTRVFTLLAGRPVATALGLYEGD